MLVVDDVDRAPVHQLGSAIENHAAFPNRVNVEFIQIVDRSCIRQRTWERGTGETLACGSGACAASVVTMLRGAVDRKVVVELRGGELEIALHHGLAERFRICGPGHTNEGRTRMHIVMRRAFA